MPYTLGALESAQSVAERFGISVAELRKLNQFRTFARGFDNVRQGDELDVPAQVSEKKLTPPPGNSSDNLEQQIASTSQQIGSLLAEDMNSEQAANMARGWASSQASGAMTDWLSRFGTARITLGVDEDFSLKNSQFDFLHPWYETPDNLFFSQHTLHRTNERTQINNGLGWRHFTPTWMSGINFFFDHDLSRYHSRAGIGAEYWRDYLKLSSNGYLRLTNWRSAPELDNDYEARPANGWDVRAEGWLPAWPHLGGKLVYEQYYGDEVALFDKDDRQSNPHAITAGLNYTPFPLMTFSAEQRQGKQGENDTRFAVDFTWQPGSAMQKQLDPNEVAARRSLAGSRYDLVTGTLAGTHMITARLANSNVSDTQPMTFVADKDRAVVVLQTSKAEIIGNGVDETTLTATVKDPFDNVVKNLSVAFSTSPADTQLSLNARNTNENGIAEVTLKGTVLGVHTAEATLPNGNNDTKTVNIAPDTSNAQVTLNIPAQQVVTNNSDSVQLTATVKDPSNHPVAGITVNFTMPQDVAANFTLETNGIAITQANGEAHVTLKGKKAGTHTVTATLGNNNASDAQPVTFVADKDSAVVVLQTSKAEIIGNGVDETTLTATVKDPFDNAVKDLQVTFSTNPADTQLSQSTSNTNDSGVAEVTLKGTVLGVHTVEATLPNGNGYTTTVNIAPDTSNAQVTLNIPAQQVVTNNSDSVQLAATVKDPSNHPVAGITVTFTMPQDVAANFTLENNGIAIT